MDKFDVVRGSSELTTAASLNPETPGLVPQVQPETAQQLSAEQPAALIKKKNRLGEDDDDNQRAQKGPRKPGSDAQDEGASGDGQSGPAPGADSGNGGSAPAGEIAKAGGGGGSGGGGLLTLGAIASGGLIGAFALGGSKPNVAPVAQADTASATEDGAAVTGSVAGNDSDPDGDPLTYSLGTPVAGLTLNADGTYRFDPANAAYQDLRSGQTRTVVANYTVSDGKGGSASSTLTITVTGTNDAPVATADTATATEDAAAVTGTVASNDRDAEGDTLTYALNAPVAGLTLNANGSYSFDPSNAAYQDLAAGQTRSVIATYTVSDGNGGTATSTLTITVTGTNDAPVAAVDSAAATEDAAPVTGTVATNDSDLDGDTLTYALDAPVAGLTLNPNGSYSFDPSVAAYQDLAAGATRNVVASYTVSDGKGGTATSTLTIVVTGANDAPVGTAESFVTLEDTPLAGSLLGNDTDIDGDSLTASIVGGPQNGTVVLNPQTGTFVYTPNANFNGTDSFTYVANDGTANSAPVTVTITVTAVNDAPVSQADTYTLDENTMFVAPAPGVLANDTDPDSPTFSAALVSSTSNGVLSFNPDGSFTYAPNPDFYGTDSFTYRANDGTDSGAVTTVTLVVRNVNAAPTGTADSYTINEDQTLAIMRGGVLGNDSDPDNDTLTAVLETGPQHGSLTLNADGTFSYTPNPDFNGPDSFTYRPHDGTVAGDPVTVNITVSPVNDAPRSVVDSYSVNEDGVLNIGAATGLLANDIDPEFNPMTAILVTGPANGTLSMNTNGSFVYTPNANFHGTDTFSYRASDGSLDGAITTVTITVNPVNDAPVGVNDSYVLNEDQTLTIAAAAGVLANDRDVDNDPLTATLLTGPAHGSLTLNANGSFVYTPNANYNGTDSFTYRPNDASVSAAPVTVNLTVNPVNDAPQASDDGLQTNEDAPVTGAAPGLLGNDLDIDSTSLTVVSINGQPASVGTPILLPSGALVTVQANGSYVYNPNGAFESLRPGQIGADSFQYTVSDGSLTDTGTVNVAIEGRNEVPIAGDDAFTMTGNTPITFTAAQLLGNDTDPDGPASGLTITGVSAGTNGTVVNNGDGTFTFTPTTGFQGAASFTYTVSDPDGGTDTGTVNLTVSGLVWYVDNSYAGANGAPDGSFQRPFTQLTQLNGVTGDGSTTDDVDGAGNTIFVANTGVNYVGGIALEADQKLFGDGHEFTVNGIQIGGGSTSNPTINHSAYGVTLSTGNEIRGLNFNGTDNATVAFQDGNGSVGNLTIAGVSSTGQGKAVDIDQGGTLAVQFNTLSSTGSTSEGVHLQGVSGSFTATAGTIQGATNQGFLIGAAGGGTPNSGGNATITYGGAIQNAGGAAVEIQDRNGGVVTFSGNITEAAGEGIVADGNAGAINFSGQISINSGASTAISLTNNTGAVAFNPTGNGLDITTTTGSGFFVAGGGGTVSLSGTGNSVSTGSGRAVHIDGVSIATGGVNFQSVGIADGASTTGIFLRNAGSGGFNITGSGSTAGSGGTINSIDTGASLSADSGIGIYIENSSNIALSNMNFTGNFGNFGIRGVNVNNFTLRDSVFNGGDADDGGFGDSAADDEGVIRFTNLTGTALFEGNNLSDGHEDVIRIDNDTGALNMTVRDSATNQAVIGRNGTLTGNDGILVLGSGASNITLLVDGVDFTGSRGDLVQTDAREGATQNVTIRNSNFINLHPDVVSGGGGITLGLSAGTGSGPNVTYSVLGNTFRGAEGTVILASAIGPVGRMSGVIFGNTIGTANGTFDQAQANTGANNSGDGIAVRVEKLSGPGDLTHAVRIEGNTLRDIDGNGIFLRSNGAADGSGTARLEATIRNNTIAELGDAGFAGIYAQIGGNVTNDDGLMGLEIANNTISMAGAINSYGGGISFDDMANASQFYLPGFNGPYADANLLAYLTGTKGNVISMAGATFPTAFTSAQTGTFASGSGFVLPTPLMVEAGFAPSGQGTQATEAALESLREAAIQLWVDAGASEAQIAAMRAIELGVANLYGGFLGQTTADGILIDADGAGLGWFIDSTPQSSEEFGAGRDGLTAPAGSAAAGGLDLLTALAHELGHVAGLDDRYNGADDGLMHGFLAPGERHLPAPLATSAGQSGAHTLALPVELVGEAGGFLERLAAEGFDLDTLFGSTGGGRPSIALPDRNFITTFDAIGVQIQQDPLELALADCRVL